MIMNCLYCGNPLPKKSPQEQRKGGQPPKYCSDNCRQYYNRRKRVGKKTVSLQQNDEQPLPAIYPLDTSAKGSQSPLPTTTISTSPPIAIVEIKPPTPTVEPFRRHELIRVKEQQFYCRICHFSWNERPKRDCPLMHMYSKEDIPPYLLTHRQLKEQGLFTREKPVAVIYAKKAPGFQCLYDVRKATPIGRGV